MKNPLLFMPVACALFCGCSQESATPPKSPDNSSGNPITAPVDYLGAAAKGKKAAEKTLDTAGLKQTIQLYQAQEGKLPKSLNDLVGPDYLSQLPAPPAGMKFDYNPATGDLKVVPK